jgi:hypothetical protein
MNEDLNNRIVVSLSESLLNESLTYDQLVAATHDFWNYRFKSVQYVQSQPPEIVVLKTGDIDLAFCFKSSTNGEHGGSGKPHYGAIVFYAKKSDVLSKLKGWWDSLKAKLSKIVHARGAGQKKEYPVPPKILTGDDLRHMRCKVSCDCEDFLYRMEVANHAHGAADIKHSNGKRPNTTNPHIRPGLCKHLLATLRYLTKDTEIFADEVKK